MKFRARNTIRNLIADLIDETVMFETNDESIESMYNMYKEELCGVS